MILKEAHRIFDRNRSSLGLRFRAPVRPSPADLFPGQLACARQTTPGTASQQCERQVPTANCCNLNNNKIPDQLQKRAHWNGHSYASAKISEGIVAKCRPQDLKMRNQWTPPLWRSMASSCSSPSPPSSPCFTSSCRGLSPQLKRIRRG